MYTSISNPYGTNILYREGGELKKFAPFVALQPLQQHFIRRTHSAMWFEEIHQRHSCSKASRIRKFHTLFN